MTLPNHPRFGKLLPGMDREISDIEGMARAMTSADPLNLRKHITWGHPMSKSRAVLGASLFLDIGYGELDDSLLADCQAGVRKSLAPVMRNGCAGGYVCRFGGRGSASRGFGVIEKWFRTCENKRSL